MKLNSAVTVGPHVTIQDALKLLSREGFDQAPVVDETGWVETAVSDWYVSNYPTTIVVTSGCEAGLGT